MYVCMYVYPYKSVYVELCQSTCLFHVVLYHSIVHAYRLILLSTAKDPKPQALNPNPCTVNP